MTKICSVCNTEKSTDEFHVNNKRKDRLNFRCKPCQLIYGKQHYKPEAQAKYRALHKENAKQYSIIYRRENEITLKTKKKEYYKKHIQESKEYQVMLKSKNPEKYTYHKAKRRAKEHKIDFNLELQDITIPKTCSILGIPLFYQSVGVSPNSPSIDRVDNAKGYIKGNIQVISWRANDIKGDATLEELVAVGKWAEAQLNKKDS